MITNVVVTVSEFEGLQVASFYVTLVITKNFQIQLQPTSASNILENHLLDLIICGAVLASKIKGVLTR